MIKLDEGRFYLQCDFCKTGKSKFENTAEALNLLIDNNSVSKWRQSKDNVHICPLCRVEGLLW